MGTTDPTNILRSIYSEAAGSTDESCIKDEGIQERVRYVCRSQIGAGVRVLLACSLAKVHDPSIDIQKPYTELGEGAYSGRSYDEQYVTGFIHEYELPCNVTTAFLTPALRTKNIVLQPGVNLGGRNRKLYDDMIQLLADVKEGHISAQDLLCETIRNLLQIKRKREQRLSSMLEELRSAEREIPLSSEDIVELIGHHLGQPKSSRLPVLVVAAAYEAASENLGERVLPLQAHNAADERTGALGDLEIALTDEDNVVTAYEMKMKKVTKDDVDRALQKLRGANGRIDNYIFITTDVIDEGVAEYAQSLYQQTGGIEFAILDCLGFLRHFLHLFHRLRLAFLESYQDLLLSEPESAVRQQLKQVFLALRQSAESAYSENN